MDSCSGMHDPDTITISEHQMQDLRAAGADLRCTCTARRRLGTPREVQAVQAALARAEFPRDCLTIQNITHDSEFGGCLAAVVIAALIAAGVVAYVSLESLSVGLPIVGGVAAVLAIAAWFIVRSTRYAFVIRCGDTAAVERALDIVGRAGEAVAVNATDWRYEIDAAELGDWAVRCIERANARAATVAEALGVQVVGVYSYEEWHELPRRNYSAAPDAAMAEDAKAPVAAARKSSLASLEPASVPLAAPTGSERGGAHVTVRYRVAGYAPREPARPTEAAPPDATSAPPAD